MMFGINWRNMAHVGQSWITDYSISLLALQGSNRVA
jgi:hypothetical protein